MSEENESRKGIRETLHDFVASSHRVLTVSKKPTWSEFLSIAKITGLGIIAIGLIGFLIRLIANLLNLF
ncbi:MAG: protein translocase SEC61 complex subunit gamma [Candidatus Diapherotrites archaeon]|nr:protein translocase SEC61 complex subunit gamma [Candidatus Diapherotrites archaeon]